MPENRLIIYIGKGTDDPLFKELQETQFKIKFFNDLFLAYSESLSIAYFQKELPFAFIIRENDNQEEILNFTQSLRKCPPLEHIPAVVYNSVHSRQNLNMAKKSGVDDYYSGSFHLQDMLDRIEFLSTSKKKKANKPQKTEQYPDLRISTAKRLFDIVISSFALLVFSPVLLLIAILIKIESPGPIFYISKRVGTGYRIFNFYKFRSMRPDADKLMKDMMHLNQYKDAKAQAFVKFENDPRITRIGQFIRKTSLDEIPQLYNVLRGDMSIVGNRPLPLYEAEQITKDLWSKRFLAPAGITGLWQVTKRGKKEMSVEERIDLDMAYADNCTIWDDLKIVALTFPALLQKESV